MEVYIIKCDNCAKAHEFKSSYDAVGEIVRITMKDNRDRIQFYQACNVKCAIQILDKIDKGGNV